MSPKTPLICFEDALAATLSEIDPLRGETIPVAYLVGRVTADDLIALVDSPSIDVSLKDGYAVRSADVIAATPQHPVPLKLIGDLAAAGDPSLATIQAGDTVRILSGAAIPEGADAVLAEEFADEEGDTIIATADAGPGRNILPKGTDVCKGQCIIPAGTVLRPAQVGLLAAAGHHEAAVVKQPRVAIIATGTEVIAPGHPLKAGKIYASNLVTLSAWCRHYGMTPSTTVVADDREAIEAALVEALEDHDALVTSGGAWTGERDLVARLLDAMGWRKVYHRVRIGPGKAVGFGLRRGKPVFILPGGPPSNQMAFLQLALPGLHRLAGFLEPGLPTRSVRLAATVTGQRDWTQFIEGRFEKTRDGIEFRPQKQESRLQSMANCEGYLMIPEGISSLEAGQEVSVQTLPFVNLLRRSKWS
ncbi:MAG: molybdopterin molybdotransferase MoeA [Chloroflexota bacterium]|jgi:molybdopterin molybdotransferase